MVKTVLIIDDSPDFREAIADILVDQDFVIYEASCPAEAFEVLTKDKMDLIICDLNMPFTSGSDACEYVQGNQVGINTIRELGWVYPGTPIIAISAAAPWELKEAAACLGDLPLLQKPVSPQFLMKCIEHSFALDFGDAMH